MKKRQPFSWLGRRVICALITLLPLKYEVPPKSFEICRTEFISGLPFLGAANILCLCNKRIDKYLYFTFRFGVHCTVHAPVPLQTLLTYL